MMGPKEVDEIFEQLERDPAFVELQKELGVAFRRYREVFEQAVSIPLPDEWWTRVLMRIIAEDRDAALEAARAAGVPNLALERAARKPRGSE